MPGNIKGLTIEISADITGFEKEIREAGKSIRDTQKDLKQVEKLLKFDPKNVELLTQKQKLLKDAINETKKKLELEKAELQKLKSADQTPEVRDRMEKLERQIIADEQALEKLENQYKDFGSVAKQQLKAVGQELQDAGDKVKDFGQKLAPVSAAAAALGGALVKLGYDAVTGADDLNTLAKQTGFTTEEIQKMKYASDLVDVSFEDISGALKKLKKNMEGHDETWEKLGVNVKNADGSMRDATDVFYDTLQALSKVGNETERDQLAMDIFGKSADELAGIVDDGGESLKTYGDKAKEMGLILEQDTIDKLNKTNDTIDELKANVSATLGQVGAELATELAPTLEKLSGHIEDITSKIRELTPEQETTLLVIAGIVAVLAPLTILLGTIISSVGTIVGAIGTLTGVLGPVIAGIGAFAASFAGPIAAIAAAIAIGVLLYKNWDKICAKAAELKDKVVAKFEELKTGATEKLESMKTAALEKWNTLKSNISTAAENIKSTVTSKFNAVKEAMIKPIESAKEKIDNAITKIKNIVNNAKLSLPKIKLPHFKISGSFSLNPPSIPHVSVDWYRKAHQNAILFTQPTVLPTAGGYKGFGDGGAEVVMDYGKLAEMAGSTYNITVNAAPGMDVNDLADAVADRIEFVTQQRRAVFA